MAKKATMTNLHEFINNQVCKAHCTSAESFLSILGDIIRQCAKEGKALPTNAEMAKQMGRSTRSVSYYLESLKANNKVVSIKGTCGRVIHIPNTEEFIHEEITGICAK